MRLRAVLRILSAGLLIYLTASAFPGLAAASSYFSHPPQSKTVSEDEYWNLVEHTRQIVAGLKGFPPEKVELELLKLTIQWSAVEAIRLDSGPTVEIDNAYLLSTLQAKSPDLEHVKALLQELQTAHTRYPEQVFTAAELGSLRSILARPEFQWQASAPNPLREWLGRLWERINEWLNNLFGGGPITLAVNPGAWSWLALLTSILLVVILLYISRNLILDFVSDARLQDDGTLDGELLTSDAALQKARDLSRGGDYRSAVRYLYLSSLLLLDERGLLRYDRSKTNREYLQSLTGSPGLARPLGEVIEVFDNVWYGNHSLDADSFQHYTERVEELKEQGK